MRAVRIHRYGDVDALSVDDVASRRPRVGEVRVEVHAAALNPKDVLVRKGKLRLFTGRRFPQRTGYDVAGVVAAVGPGVKRLRAGDEVYGMLGGWRAGAHAEEVTCAARSLALRPTGVSMEEAAAAPLAAMTALQAMAGLMRLQSGEEILINGASGGVGVFAVQIARLLGARPVAVCSARNEGFVRELGAAEVLPYDVQPLSETDRRFDAFFDVFGSAPFPKAKRHLASRGRYVTTIPRPDTAARDLLSRFGPRPARLVVVAPRPRDLARIAVWMDQGRLRAIVDRVLPLEAIADGHRYLETKRARGKVVLRVR